MFGQAAEIPADWPQYDLEREATSDEIEVWNQLEKRAENVRAVSHMCVLQVANMGLVNAYMKQSKTSMEVPEGPALYDRYLAARNEIKELSAAMFGVDMSVLAVQFRDGDIDIVKPGPFVKKPKVEVQIGPAEPIDGLGAIWLPIAIGAVVVAGIIARWAYLEKEVNDISDQFNGILKRADDHLCQDPSSPMCKNWEVTKENGGYYERETVIDSIKNAVKKTGTVLKKGLGIGAVLALPLLALFLMPKKG